MLIIIVIIVGIAARPEPRERTSGSQGIPRRARRPAAPRTGRRDCMFCIWCWRFRSVRWGITAGVLPTPDSSGTGKSIYWGTVAFYRFCDSYSGRSGQKAKGDLWYQPGIMPTMPHARMSLPGSRVAADPVSQISADWPQSSATTVIVVVCVSLSRDDHVIGHSTRTQQNNIVQLWLRYGMMPMMPPMMMPPHLAQMPTMPAQARTSVLISMISIKRISSMSMNTIIVFLIFTIVTIIV